MSTKRNAPEMLAVDRIKVVKAYAKTHYDEGWDVVIEGWSDAEIAKTTAGCKTELGCLRKMSAAFDPEGVRRERELEEELERGNARNRAEREAMYSVDDDIRLQSEMERYRRSNR